MNPDFSDLISQFGIDDTDEVRDALLEAFMTGVVTGMADTTVQQMALDFFSDEEDIDG